MIEKNKLQAYRRIIFGSVGLILAGILLISLSVASLSSPKTQAPTVGLTTTPIASESGKLLLNSPAIRANNPEDGKGVSTLNVTFTVPKEYEAYSPEGSSGLFYRRASDGSIDESVSVAVIKNDQERTLDDFMKNYLRGQTQPVLAEESFEVRDYIGKRVGYSHLNNTKLIVQNFVVVPRKRFVEVTGIPREVHVIGVSKALPADATQQQTDQQIQELRKRSIEFLDGYGLEESIENN